MSTDSIPESRLADIERTIHETNYNLLETINREQIEIDRLKEKLESISTQIESDRNKKLVKSEEAIDIGVNTCTNADDFALHGKIIFVSFI